MRKPLVAANWKMNTTAKEAIELVDKLIPPLKAIPGVEKVLCPPFIWLSILSEKLKGTDIRLGAQNMYYQERGAYTGEISPLMLREHCQYVILGHSERRRYFGEDNRLINLKLLAALKHGLNPIFCVGETLDERRQGRTEEIIGAQIREGLEGIADPGGLVIAYEPVWAIGTGIAASGKEVVEVGCFIRRLLGELFGRERERFIQVLYGGSVDQGNIKEFVGHPEIDGVLVGGASLKAEKFVEIVRTVASLRKVE